MALFNKGAMARMKERRANRKQREVMNAPVETRFLEDTEMAGPHTEPVKEAPLSKPPKIKPAVDPVGEKVFPDETSFKEAFRQARDSGEKLFDWQGKQYNTLLKEEKSEMLTDFVPGFKRERDVADIPAAKTVGNRLFQTEHPINEQGSNVLLQSIGGEDPSGEHPPEPVKAIPTMIDGIKYSGKEAAEKYHEMGLMESAPEFKTVEQAEKWIEKNHGKISPKGRLLDYDQSKVLDVKTTRTAPTFKMLSAMEAPTEVEKLPGREVPADQPPKLHKIPGSSGDYTADMINETKGFNKEREAEGLKPLVPTSGYRAAEKNVRTMINAITKPDATLAEVKSNYKKLYHPSIEAYFANPTEENLEKIREVRRAREEGISSGHAHYDAMDYSVKGMNKAEADATVKWLRDQGKKVKLEYWGKSNAHIHIEGVVH
jgi:hypothetical protein